MKTGEYIFKLIEKSTGNEYLHDLAWGDDFGQINVVPFKNQDRKYKNITSSNIEKISPDDVNCFLIDGGQGSKY